jgi:hypothetical protein
MLTTREWARAVAGHKDLDLPLKVLQVHDILGIACEIVHDHCGVDEIQLTNWAKQMAKLGRSRKSRRLSLYR